MFEEVGHILVISSYITPQQLVIICGTHNVNALHTNAGHSINTLDQVRSMNLHKYLDIVYTFY